MVSASVRLWMRVGIGLLFIGMSPALRAQVALTGVNLAGADFGERDLPGTYDVHYTYPTPQEVDYYVGKGVNAFRIPFRWERLQRSQNAGRCTGRRNSTDSKRL